MLSRWKWLQGVFTVLRKTYCFVTRLEVTWKTVKQRIFEDCFEGFNFLSSRIIIKCIYMSIYMCVHIYVYIYKDFPCVQALTSLNCSFNDTAVFLEISVFPQATVSSSCPALDLQDVCG